MTAQGLVVISLKEWCGKCFHDLSRCCCKPIVCTRRLPQNEETSVVTGFVEQTIFQPTVSARNQARNALQVQRGGGSGFKCVETTSCDQVLSRDLHAAFASLICFSSHLQTLGRSPAAFGIVWLCGRLTKLVAMEDTGTKYLP